MKTSQTIETNKEMIKNITSILEEQAIDGDADSIKLLLEIKKQQEVDSLRKELFG